GVVGGGGGGGGRPPPPAPPPPPPLHSWQMTAQGCSTLAHTGMVHVAKAMAATGAELIRNMALLDRVRAAHAGQVAQQPYISPMPLPAA
ncbi:MAG: hypothetical protein ABF479_09965, partial [Gluconacetobacter sp.]